MGFDRGIFVWVVEHRWGPLDPVFVGLTLAGYLGLAFIALAPLVALRARRPVLLVAATTAATVWVADLATLGLKTVFDRPRPPLTVPEADPLFGGSFGDSFPSGHAATSFAGGVLLALLLPRWSAPLLVLAAGIAFSRVYVGVHYPGDVVAGAAIGALFGIAGALLVRRRMR